PAGEWTLLPELEGPIFLRESWKRVAAALAARGPEIIPDLCRYLYIKDVSVSRAIEETFKLLAGEHLEAVHAAALEADAARIRRFLLFVLGEVAANGSRDVFLSCLADDSSAVQATALRGLYRLQVPCPPGAAAALAASPSSAVRRYLGLALQYADDELSREVLAALVADEDPWVRYAAGKALKKKARPF
ncbi:HEAT repeat domain-containing protein, partial [Thermodesulfobacteriota bacterium]